MTAASAVLDANVFIRSAVQTSTSAREWLDAVEAEELDGHVPELVYAEVASALLKYVRVGRMAAGDAAAALEIVVALPLQVVGLRELATAAFARAVETGLSAYDCCYAVLAESLEVPLITTDRRLALAVSRAELLD